MADKNMFNITVLDSPTTDDIDFLRLSLIENNRVFVGEHVRKPLVLFITDSSGEKIGGISGQTYGKWLSIDYLWVADKARNLKIGSQLLFQAEKEAQKRGCLYAQVDTFSFQAKPFYEKHGYVLKMTLKDYPEEHERYYLIKVFN